MARAAKAKPELVTLINDNLKPSFIAAVKAIEALETEKSEIAASISDEYKSLKEKGVDTKAVREVVKLRKMDQASRDAYQDRIDAYMVALGMLADTPLGQAAVQSISQPQPSA